MCGIRDGIPIFVLIMKEANWYVVNFYVIMKFLYFNCYSLTPRCRVLPEQLTGLQLVKKFPAFHGTRMFITALTSVRHLSLQSKHLTCECFLKMFCYREGLLAPRPTPKLEDHPSSAVRDCLFNLFATTLLIGGCSSIRNLRTRHVVVTGTH